MVEDGGGVVDSRQEGSALAAMLPLAPGARVRLPLQLHVGAAPRDAYRDVRVEVRQGRVEVLSVQILVACIILHIWTHTCDATCTAWMHTHAYNGIC